MHELKMPQAGQSMQEGTIIRWLKKEGQSVSKGEVVLEVETDKAVVEVESETAGILKKILCPEGTTHRIHTPLALIGDLEESLPVSKAVESVEPTAKTGASGVTPVLMPQAGQSVEEGTLVKWRVKPGDRINRGDIIFEVETDKAVVEVEATDSGRLSRIVVPEGQICKVLQTVAYLAENDSDVEAFLSGGKETAQVPSEMKPEVVPTEIHPAKVAAEVAPASSATSTGRIKVSPAARKLAVERGVELASIGSGSGPGGRIILADVEKVSTAPAEPIRRKLAGMRKAIAKNLTYSKQNVPHFYMKLTVDALPVYSLYQTEKAKYSCSLNDLIVLACGKALKQFPAMRTRLEGEELVEYPWANIGIAVALEDGLLVPVIQKVDRMNLKEVAVESRRLVEQARKGKPEGMGKVHQGHEGDQPGPAADCTAQPFGRNLYGRRAEARMRKTPARFWRRTDGRGIRGKT